MVDIRLKKADQNADQTTQKHTKLWSTKENGNNVNHCFR
jgi:hypothetical protein